MQGHYFYVDADADAVDEVADETDAVGAADETDAVDAAIGTVEDSAASCRRCRHLRFRLVAVVEAFITLV